MLDRANTENRVHFGRSCNKRNVSCTEFWKYNAEDVGWRASCSNAQAFANRMSRASVTGANGNARMSANPFETESI